MSPSSSSFTLFAPDGQLHDVPADHVSDALRSGGERAILFNAPDGKQRWVRLSQAQQARASGGEVVPPGASAPTGVIRPLTNRERFLDPNLYPVGQKDEGLGENLHNLGQRAGVGIFQLADAVVNPGQTVRSLASSLLPDQVVNRLNQLPGPKSGKSHPLPTGVPNPVQQAYNAMNTSRGPMELAGKAAPLAGQALVTMGLGKIAPAVMSDTLEMAGKARRVIPNMLDRDLGPVGAKVGDQTVQLLKGEAHPASGGGNLQKVIKDSGVGAWRFDRFAAEQLEQVKRVIRNTAQQTSDLIGPVSQDPAAALDDASSAVFSRAKPMYQQLDAALVRVPVKFTAASKIMTSALTRARKLGVDISPVDENVQGLGVDNIKSMQPLTTVTQVRSALLRAKRAAVDSGDAQLANSISDEVRSLNGEIDSVLSGTPLQAAWHEANRLWSKGHAISDTAYAFYKSTRGTPEAIQSPELGKIPVKIQGSSLVSKLNDLKREGTLDRGFTPEEQLNLRRSADIMDRARESAGYDTGTTPGHVYSFHTLLWRTLLRLPAIPLVRIMTSTKGMRALALAERATTPVQFNAAIAPLLAGIPVAAAGSQANQSISPAQAIQAMQPNTSQGAPQ